MRFSQCPLHTIVGGDDRHEIFTLCFAVATVASACLVFVGGGWVECSKWEIGQNCYPMYKIRRILNPIGQDRVELGRLQSKQRNKGRTTCCLLSGKLYLFKWNWLRVRRKREIVQIKMEGCEMEQKSGLTPAIMTCLLDSTGVSWGPILWPSRLSRFVQLFSAHGDAKRETRRGSGQRESDFPFRKT